MKTSLPAVALWLAFTGAGFCQQGKEVSAEQVYRNIRALKGHHAKDLLPFMENAALALGVDCDFCHSRADWASDDKRSKLEARKMIEMTDWLNREQLRMPNRISCNTCHRGSVKPKELISDDAAQREATRLVPIAAADRDKPAEQVFHNIQAMKGTPAGQFPGIMAYFSNALGVQCAFCHLPGQWDKDDKMPKRKAREMLGIVTAAVHRYWGDNGPLGCPTCHRGKTQPE